MDGKKIIIGNWKMNPATFLEARSLLNNLKTGFRKPENVDAVICPPAIWLKALVEIDKDKPGMFQFGAQNMSWQESGALTGEISAPMLKEAGAKYAIIGHSERRVWLGETDNMINGKIITAFKNNITPVLCVGEIEGEKKSATGGSASGGEGITKEAIGIQIGEALSGISRGQIEANRIIVAYEPIWAIGSGVTPTFDEVLSAALLIKKTLVNLYSRDTVEKIPILYGGSVNSGNAKDFVEKGGVDGLLIGGASIKASEFAGIIRAVSN